MYKIITAVMTSLFLSACSGSTSVTQADQATITYQLPPEPDRTANNATLAGIDTTGTGVRDDIHRMIFNTYTSTVKRKIGMAIAKESRKVFLSPPQTTAEARAYADATHLALDCLWSRREMPLKDKFKIDEALEAAHADTAARMKAYLNYNRLLNGESFRSKWNKYSCDAIL